MVGFLIGKKIDEISKLLPYDIHMLLELKTEFGAIGGSIGM